MRPREQNISGLALIGLLLLMCFSARADDAPKAANTDEARFAKLEAIAEQILARTEEVAELEDLLEDRQAVVDELANELQKIQQTFEEARAAQKQFVDVVCPRERAAIQKSLDIAAAAEAKARKTREWSAKAVLEKRIPEREGLAYSFAHQKTFGELTEAQNKRDIFEQQTYAKETERLRILLVTTETSLIHTREDYQRAKARHGRTERKMATISLTTGEKVVLEKLDELMALPPQRKPDLAEVKLTEIRRLWAYEETKRAERSRTDLERRIKSALHQAHDQTTHH